MYLLDLNSRWLDLWTLQPFSWSLIGIVQQTGSIMEAWHMMLLSWWFWWLFPIHLYTSSTHPWESSRSKSIWNRAKEMNAKWHSKKQISCVKDQLLMWQTIFLNILAWLLHVYFSLRSSHFQFQSLLLDQCSFTRFKNTSCSESTNSQSNWIDS